MIAVNCCLTFDLLLSWKLISALHSVHFFYFSNNRIETHIIDGQPLHGNLCSENQLRTIFKTHSGLIN